MNSYGQSRRTTYGRISLATFALIACTNGDGGTGVATSQVDGADIVITTIDPDTATVDTTITVRIIGSGFTDGSTATWIVDTTEVPGIRTLATTWKSPVELEARIAISPDAELRTYSVRIRPKKGKQAIAAERFRVVAKPILLPEPGVRSGALDVNDSGVIVGWASDGQGPQFAVRWAPVDTGWGFAVLGVGTAVAVNNDGQIVRRHFDEVTRRWRSWIHLPSGMVVDLGPVLVIDISDTGALIGTVFDEMFNATQMVWKQESPGQWSAPVALPIPVGYSANPTDINGAGDIAGSVYDGTISAAAVWRYQDGNWQIPELIELQLSSGASAINDAGALTGWVWPCVYGSPGCESSAAFWPPHDGTRRILPTLYNLRGMAYGINDANEIVGSAAVHYNDGTGPLAALVRHAVIWFAGGQWPEDLGAIRPWEYGEARAINNHGLVVGESYSAPLKQHATIWKLPKGLRTVTRTRQPR